MISKSFLKSSFIFTLGGSMPMLASIILLPFYTNLLAPVHYTQLIFYISISLLLQILFSYSIESYFGVRYTQLSEKPDEQKRFVGTVSTLLLLIGAGILVISMFAGNAVFGLIYSDQLGMDFWPFGFYSVLTAFFNAYFKAASVGLIYFKRARLFLLANIVNFVTTILVSIGGLYLFPGTILGPIYGRLISGFLIFLIAFFIFRNHGVFVFDRYFLSDLTAFCTPFLFFAISGWLLGQVDRFMLQRYIPIDNLNAYDLILKCFLGVEFLQNSLSAVIFPKLYEIWNKEGNVTTPESNRYSNVFNVVNIFQLIIFCICIPILYRFFITRSAFYEGERYIGVLAAGFGLRGIINFYTSTILFAKKTNKLLQIFGASAIAQVVLTFFAVRHLGLVGVIYAGLATRLLQVAFCVIFTRQVFTYRFNYFKILALPLIYLVLNVVQFIICSDYNVYLYVSQLVFFGFIFYYVFRNEIRKVLVSFKILTPMS